MMKFKNSLLFLISVVLLIFINSCKKDGPSSEEKLIAGTYDVELYLIGGFDSTASLKSNPCYGLITFESDGHIFGNRHLGSCSFLGTYGLSNNDKNITFALQGGFPEMAPLGIPVSITWQIIELKDEQMTFETIYTGKICKLKLKE